MYPFPRPFIDHHCNSKVPHGSQMHRDRCIPKPHTVGSEDQLALHHFDSASQKSDIAEAESSVHGLPPFPSGNQPSIAPTARSITR